MNAYELAYKLNNALGVDYEMLEQSSIMLRQQADRIAELEKDLHMIQRHYDQLNTQTKPLSDDEIKEVWLKRPANTAEDVVRFARAIEERHGIKNA